MIQKPLMLFLLFTISLTQIKAQNMPRWRAFREQHFKNDETKYKIYQLFQSHTYEAVIPIVKPQVDKCIPTEEHCQEDFLYLINAYLGLHKYM